MKRLYLTIFLISFIYSQNYTYVKPSRDGIGKIYMGREISGIMGHRGAGWLERSSRGYEERPDLVIKALKLGKSDIVADFGAGSGYFTKRLAPLCSLVYAVDIQKEMININKGQMNEAGIKNVLFIKAALFNVEHGHFGKKILIQKNGIKKLLIFVRV